MAHGESIHNLWDHHFTAGPARRSLWLMMLSTNPKSLPWPSKDFWETLLFHTCSIFFYLKRTCLNFEILEETRNAVDISHWSSLAPSKWRLPAASCTDIYLSLATASTMSAWVRNNSLAGWGHPILTSHPSKSLRSSPKVSQSICWAPLPRFAWYFAIPPLSESHPKLKAWDSCNWVPWLRWRWPSSAAKGKVSSAANRQLQATYLCTFSPTGPTGPRLMNH